MSGDFFRVGLERVTIIELESVQADHYAIVRRFLLH